MATESRMEKIVSLCKRRGFIFQSSEIYGGLNGFWDYGPLGAELKRNVRDAWYQDMVTRHDELSVPAGAPSAFQMVGIESSLIMHPQVWKCSGHYDLFSDKLVDCRKCKARFRADHLVVRFRSGKGSDGKFQPVAAVTYLPDDPDFGITKRKEGDLDKFAIAEANRLGLEDDRPQHPSELDLTKYLLRLEQALHTKEIPSHLLPCPRAGCDGTLTEPRPFNLMFETHTGALKDESNLAFLRPETAQGMFVNFKNVLDSTRLKLPFGIAQVGKSFRNEITPRNFTFRSREFEQMEMEFFCRPDQSRAWYTYWRDRRFAWYTRLGITSNNLQLRDHAADELSHYSVGTADIEYAFPFLEAGEYGELEGVAHRGDFDLRSHAEGKLVKKDGELVVELDSEGKPKYRGSGKDLQYFDDQTRERFYPHVIEPAAGADRTTLAFLCEAYNEDRQPDEKGEMQERVYLRLHPRLAPVKVAVFPLIKKDGMPEKAAAIYRDFKEAGIAAQFDQQAAIGRRYRRQDEIGTPFCITVDGDTMQNDTVTLRDRDSLKQERLPIKEVVEYVRQRVSKW